MLPSGSTTYRVASSVTTTPVCRGTLGCRTLVAIMIIVPSRSVHDLHMQRDKLTEHDVFKKEHGVILEQL